MKKTLLFPVQNNLIIRQNNYTKNCKPDVLQTLNKNLLHIFGLKLAIHTIMITMLLELSQIRNFKSQIKSNQVIPKMKIILKLTYNQN